MAFHLDEHELARRKPTGTPLQILENAYRAMGVNYAKGVGEEGDVFIFVRKESEPATLTEAQTDEWCRDRSFFEFTAAGELASY